MVGIFFFPFEEQVC